MCVMNFFGAGVHHPVHVTHILSRFYSVCPHQKTEDTQLWPTREKHGTLPNTPHCFLTSNLSLQFTCCVCLMNYSEPCCFQNPTILYDIEKWGEKRHTSKGKCTKYYYPLHSLPQQKGFQLKPKNLVSPSSTTYWQHTRQPEGFNTFTHHTHTHTQAQASALKTSFQLASREVGWGGPLMWEHRGQREQSVQR